MKRLRYQTWALALLLSFQAFSADEGQMVYRPRYEKIRLPYAACKNREFQIYQGHEKFLVIESKNPKGDPGDRYANGRYYKVIPQGVLKGQVPPCDHDQSWIPSADLKTGALWTDFYDHLRDYEDARSLALASGQVKLDYISEQKKLHKKIATCLSGMKSWPVLTSPSKSSNESKLTSESSCEDIGSYFVRDYLKDFRKFRLLLGVAIDSASSKTYDPKRLTTHLNSKLELPHFWPKSKLAPLTREEIGSLESVLSTWQNRESGGESLETKYKKEVSSSLQTVIELGSSYPSFFSLSSAEPQPADIQKMLSERSSGFDQAEKETRSAMEKLSGSLSSEKMDEVFDLTLNRSFVEPALAQNPDLCAAAAGIQLRKSVTEKRILGYSAAFLAGNLLARRFIPKSLEKGLTAGFLSWDAYNLYQMVHDQLSLNQSFSSSLTQTELTLGVQELVDANKMFLLNEGMLVGFAVPSVRDLTQIVQGYRAKVRAKAPAK